MKRDTFNPSSDRRLYDGSFIGLIYASPAPILSFSPNEGRSYVRTEISPHKQSHPFRDSSLPPLVSLAESLPPLRPLHSPSTIRPTRRELHSRVYHCPDNNDLPTGELLRVRFRESRRVRLVGLPEKRDEVSPMAGPKKARRAATLHSGVFHFNGPPGDWLTPTGDPSPFRHNGPLHYLFVLANVLLARTKPLVFHVLPFPRAINRTSREQGYRELEMPQ